MSDAAQPYRVDTTPPPRTYLEKIGDTHWELREAALDVFDEVSLWHENPRLRPNLVTGDFASEIDLENQLQQTPGYANLKKSIETIGQVEPVYAWRADETNKYVVFEGATRVSILRQLTRAKANGPDSNKFSKVKAKILPPHFGVRERAILLARIHVRGTGVRSWGRYIEAQFIHENVVGKNGDGPLMSISEMAKHMEKSISWVQRLKEAYQFALAFINHVDEQDAERTAMKQFSTLEEISKAATIGSMLRDYENSQYDQLRDDVFNMVRNDAFKEYRNARFLKQFYDDPEKWALLKSGEPHVADRLAAEVKQNAGSLKARIAGLEGSIERALQREGHGLDEDDIELLKRAISVLEQQIHPGVRRFRLDLKTTIKTLSEASMADIKSLSPEEVKDLKEAVDYFDMLVSKHMIAA